MQIVIEFPKDVWERYVNLALDGETLSFWGNLIANGTPLPKGHGRLIDANKFLKDNEAYTGWVLNSSDWGGENAYKDALEDLVNEAPTILEADKEKEKE
jgi:hypothetical protein